MDYYINGTKVEVGQDWIDSEGDEHEVCGINSALSYAIKTSDNKSWTKDGWEWQHESGSVNGCHLVHLKQPTKKEPTMQIERDKFYKLRDGRRVRVICIDRPIPRYEVTALSDQGGLYNFNAHGKNVTADESLDIIAPWQDPLDFDWDCLAAWCNSYIAMDESKRWWAYTSKPQPHPYAWNDPDDNWVHVIPENYHPKNYTGTWQDSLHLNPKYKDA